MTAEIQSVSLDNSQSAGRYWRSQFSASSAALIQALFAEIFFFTLQFPEYSAVLGSNKTQDVPDHSHNVHLINNQTSYALEHP